MPHMHFSRTELTRVLGLTTGRAGVSALWFRQEVMQKNSTNVITPPGYPSRSGMTGLGWNFLLWDYEPILARGRQPGTP